MYTKTCHEHTCTENIPVSMHMATLISLEKHFNPPYLYGNSLKAYLTPFYERGIFTIFYKQLYDMQPYYFHSTFTILLSRSTPIFTLIRQVRQGM